MQYLGSKWGAVALSSGVAVSVAGAQFLLEDIGEEVVPALTAAIALGPGMAIGILVWSRIGAWLKTLKGPGLFASVGLGVCFALPLAVVLRVSTTFWRRDEVIFWLAIALWHSVAYGLAVSPARPGSVPGRMQYLGSERNAVAFAFGVAACMFGVSFFDLSRDETILSMAAGAAVFAGTAVGTLVWARVGAWLKRRRPPVPVSCSGIGIGVGLVFFVVMAVATRSFVNLIWADAQTSVWLHWMIFWLSVSLWNSLGYGLALSPVPQPQARAAPEM